MIIASPSKVCVKARRLLRLIRLQSTFSTLLEDNWKTGAVLRSESTNIFENLAFEDWIHDHVDLHNRNILFLWRNTSAVVVGRHQNPWQECNVRLLRESGIPLARRRSGGGTVFHDLGNINMTFFTSKKKYDRQRNLRIVTNALNELRPGLDVRPTERFDILLNGQYKVSGSAAKLGRTAAYHHCTLLCAADRSLLTGVLTSRCHGIISNATPSVPSLVKNLVEEDPTLDCNVIMEAVASQYQRVLGFNSPVILVNPSDELCYPGIHKLTWDLQEWDWVYGKTPKFTLSTCLEVLHEGVSSTVMLSMEVKYGTIESCRIEVPSAWLPPEMCAELSTLLVGSKFCPSETAVLSAAVSRVNSRDHDLETKMNVLCQNLAAVM